MTQNGRLWRKETRETSHPRNQPPDFCPGEKPDARFPLACEAFAVCPWGLIVVAARCTAGATLRPEWWKRSGWGIDNSRSSLRPHGVSGIESCRTATELGQNQSAMHAFVRITEYLRLYTHDHAHNLFIMIIFVRIFVRYVL